MKNYLLSLPYMYPVCPISIDHARLFVIADIIARYKRINNNVFFPIAAHYSGVTADEIFDKLKRNDLATMNLYMTYYKMPITDLSNILSSTDLLDYYTEQMLENFKKLSISCDYGCFYKTNTSKYQIFVKKLFEKYAENHKIITNNAAELAIDFNNQEWRKKTYEFIQKIQFIQKFHRKNIIGSFDTISNDFGFLREYGIGTYYNETQIIDPMFDGDFFMIFDLLSKELCLENYSDEEFELLVSDVFDAVQGREYHNKEIVEHILEWLPCDMFVCEEHLKTWIVKKTFSEVLLMKEEYRTKEYFITGLGRKNNKRMSSSRGNAILLKDLLDEYGGIKARMIILMCGGHPSKNYNFDESVIKLVEDTFSKFEKFMRKEIPLYRKIALSEAEMLKKEEILIKKNIEDGYFGQAISLIMQIIPNNYKKILNDTFKMEFAYLCNRYLEILLPEIIDMIYEVNVNERI